LTRVDKQKEPSFNFGKSYPLKLSSVTFDTLDIEVNLTLGSDVNPTLLSPNLHNHKEINNLLNK